MSKRIEDIIEVLNTIYSLRDKLRNKSLKEIRVEATEIIAKKRNVEN